MRRGGSSSCKVYLPSGMAAFFLLVFLKKVRRPTPWIFGISRFLAVYNLDTMGVSSKFLRAPLFSWGLPFGCVVPCYWIFLEGSMQPFLERSFPVSSCYFFRLLFLCAAFHPLSSWTRFHQCPAFYRLPACGTVVNALITGWVGIVTRCSSPWSIHWWRPFPFPSPLSGTGRNRE